MTFKSEIVFVRILIPLILGICCAYIFATKEIIEPLIIANASLFILLLTVNIFYKKLNAYRFKGLIGLTFFIFYFAFGGLICTLNNQSLKADYYAKENYEYLKLWISSEPEQTNDILRFEAEVTQVYIDKKAIPKSGKMMLALKLDEKKPIHLKYGDELMVSAKYLPVEPPYNPAEFDFKAWLATKNVYHQTFINQNHLIKIGENKGNPIVKYAIEVRKRQVDIYRKLIKNDEAFAVASTLVLGYRSDLSKETLSAYTKTGTVHALSVSGMHVGIIYIFLNWMLFFLDKNGITRILKLVLICSLIWYYSLLTGFSPSVLRSAVMLTVFITAKSFNKSSNSYNILAFTAICLLIYNPFLVWDVGFQLSFLAVFGLVYLQPKIYKWIYVKNKWLDKLWATVAMSLAAQLATYPL
ncbi:MAG: ComEC family competence protein, partial [Pedobacter sp.]